MNALVIRAVACKNWYVEVGMVDLNGMVVRNINKDWVLDGFGVATKWDAFRPDLSHPATLGCVEYGLLPAAGYNDAHVMAYADSTGAVFYCVTYRPDPILFPTKWLSVDDVDHNTRADALISALEAAPS